MTIEVTPLTPFVPPIIVPCRLVQEFRDCEEASWEDAGSPEGEELTTEKRPEHTSPEDWEAEGGNVPFLHGYQVLSRHPDRIELRNRAELADIWYRLCTGTFGVHHATACRNVARRLIEAAGDLLDGPRSAPFQSFPDCR